MIAGRECRPAEAAPNRTARLARRAGAARTRASPIVDLRARGRVVSRVGGLRARDRSSTSCTRAEAAKPGTTTSRNASMRSRSSISSSSRAPSAASSWNRSRRSRSESWSTIRSSACAACCANAVTTARSSASSCGSLSNTTPSTPSRRPVTAASSGATNAARAPCSTRYAPSRILRLQRRERRQPHRAPSPVRVAHRRGRRDRDPPNASQHHLAERARDRDEFEEAVLGRERDAGSLARRPPRARASPAPRPRRVCVRRPRSPS